MLQNFIESVTPSNGAARTPERRRGSSWYWDDRFAFLLDQIDYGMLVLAGDHSVRYANHAAREALAGEHPLSLHGDELRARVNVEAGALRKALESARRGLRSLLVFGSGGRSVGVAVVPLQGALARRSGGASEPEMLLVLGKSAVGGDMAVGWYARLHGLTAAETAVLNQLCSGALPTEIARRQGVALSTIRTQIGSIRAKTGARTIAAVQRKVAALPPMVSALHRSHAPVAPMAAGEMALA